MPFIDVRKPVQNITNLTGPEPVVPPTALETFGAAFRTENVVGSWLAARGMPDPDEVEEGFNAIDYIKDDADFAPYARAFAGVRNQKAADALKLQIKQEQKDRRTKDAAGGLGVVADIAAGLLDLPSFLPIGGALAVGGRSLLGTAVGAAAGAAIDATVSETGLHLTQVTRTGEESVYNIGGSIILGGALGTAVGRYLSSVEASQISRKIENSEKEYDTFDQAFVSTGAGQSAGAAARERGPLTLKDEAIISRLPIANRQDPLIRLQLSEYDTARETVRRLAETPLEYAENAQGVATEIGGSVETRMKMWNAPLATTLQGIDADYAKYFYGTPEVGSFKTAISPMLSELQAWRGGQKLTAKQFREEVGKAAFSGGKHDIPEVAAAAQRYREIDESMKRAAIDAGLFPEDVAVAGDVSHLFRMYNREKIIAQRGEFARILEDYFKSARDAAARALDAEAAAGKAAKAADEKQAEFAKLLDGEIRDLVEETIDTILGNSEGRIPYDSIVSGPRGPLKERLLRIESAKIQNFMELDIERVLQAQVRTMSADVEIAKKFGSVDMAEEIRKVNDEANRKIAKVDGDKSLTEAQKQKQRTRLQKDRANAIRDINGIRDRLRGQYKLPSNPDGLILRANRVARNLNYVRLLGGMTISAIPDMGKVIFTHGLTSTFRDGFVPMVRNMKGFRAAAEEVKMAGTALDMVLDSRTMALADITGDFGRHSMFERGLQAASSRFGVVSLMAPWNAAMKQFSGLVTMTNILKSAERLAKGAPNKNDVRKLAASGINSDLAERITKQFREHGKVEDGIYLAGGEKWTDRQALEAFRTAVVRDVDRIIVTPGQDKPLWMSTELGKTVGQFRSFAVSSMQRTLLAGLQQRDAATLNGLLVMLGLGAMTYWAKEFVAGRETSDDVGVWAANAIDRSGVFGWLMEANGLLEKGTRGEYGLSMLTGEQMTRFQSRNVWGTLAGPSVGAIEDIFQISGSIFAGDTSKADLRKARQLVPMQNLFYARWLFDQVENATGDAIGLPERGK